MKNLFAGVALVMATIFGTTNAQAQSYKTGAGLLVDFGDGTTLVGPHLKHFFSANNAGEFSVLFGGHTTTVQALYQYNKGFSGASGLMWYVGVGPAVSFYDGGSTFSVVPTAGLDYKISGAPLDLSFDWRPRMSFYDGDSDFAAGRFGLGLRFTF
ncbi:MAG: hypothetical protein QM564_08125 [Bergeyella sp.]